MQLIIGGLMSTERAKMINGDCCITPVIKGTVHTFVVQKTFLEFRNKTVLQNSHKEKKTRYSVSVISSPLEALRCQITSSSVESATKSLNKRNRRN